MVIGYLEDKMTSGANGPGEFPLWICDWVTV